MKKHYRMKPQKVFKQIKLIYFIVTILLGVFALLSYAYINVVGQPYELDVNAAINLKSVTIILALVGIPVSYVFHKRKVSHINEQMSADKKLMQYRTSYFIKIMTLEGISLISLLGYLMSANLNQLLIFGLVYVFLIFNYPGKNGILQELKLNQSDL